VGVYPAKGYDVLLEFGGCKQTPILLKEPQVQILAIHLPVLCVEMCNDKQYSSGSKKSECTLSTTKAYRTARLKHSDKYIVYRLHDLQNLLRILYLAHEQQNVFLEALPDILDYANIAITSSDYVEPVTANNNIQYKQLFDELKSISI
jgi:hypothetical protein